MSLGMDHISPENRRRTASRPRPGAVLRLISARRPDLVRTTDGVMVRSARDIAQDQAQRLQDQAVRSPGNPAALLFRQLTTRLREIPPAAADAPIKTRIPFNGNWQQFGIALEAFTGITVTRPEEWFRLLTEEVRTPSFLSDTSASELGKAQPITLRDPTQPSGLSVAEIQQLAAHGMLQPFLAVTPDRYSQSLVVPLGERSVITFSVNLGQPYELDFSVFPPPSTVTPTNLQPS